MCNIWDEMDELIHDFYDEGRSFNDELSKLKNKAQSRALLLPETADGVAIRPGWVYYDTGLKEKFTAWLVNDAQVMDDWHDLHDLGEVTAEIPERAVTRAEHERIEELSALLEVVHGSDGANVEALIADRLSELGVKEDCE